jgi:hypothetical protein
MTPGVYSPRVSAPSPEKTERDGVPPDPPKASPFAALLREPLAHFLALGALLFLIDALRGDPAPTAASSAAVGEPEVTRTVVIDDGVRRALVDAYRHEHGEEPSEEALRESIERYVDEEILYREGLARHLDEGDERVRMRVVALMADVLDATETSEPPTDAEVRAYFEASPERWAEPARLDFVHVFVTGQDAAAQARATELLAALEGGASPSRMGDTFSGGRHYRGRRIEDLESAFGESFVLGLAELPIERWAIVPSRFGLHVVRIEQRSEAGPADFGAARADVERALSLERRQAHQDRVRAALRARWEIIESPSGSP